MSHVYTAIMLTVMLTALPGERIVGEQRKSVKHELTAKQQREADRYVEKWRKGMAKIDRLEKQFDRTPPIDEAHNAAVMRKLLEIIHDLTDGRVF